MKWFVLLFVLLPTAQLGSNTYASVAVAGCVFLFAFAYRSLGSLITYQLGLRLATCVCMFLSFALYPDQSQDILLRMGREAVILFVLTGLAANCTAELDRRTAHFIVRLIAIFSISALCLCTYQAMAYARSQYFGIPESYFAVDSGTIPKEFSLIYSAQRPAATYSEPSYLGFVSYSLVFAISPLLTRYKDAMIAVACFVLVLIVSKTASGLLSIGVLIFMITRSYSRKWSHLIPASIILIIFISYVSGIDIQLFDRLSSISDQSAEASGFDRLVAPLLAVPQLVSHHPFGLSLLTLINSNISTGTTESWIDILHNAVFTIIYTYGVFGIVVIVCLGLCMKHPLMGLYILLAAFQNGSLLGIDKLFVILTSCLIFNSFSIFARRKENSPLGQNELHRTRSLFSEVPQ